MSQIDLLLEAERRGILPADKAGLLAEARRRGLVAGGGTPAAEQPATGDMVPVIGQSGDGNTPVTWEPRAVSDARVAATAGKRSTVVGDAIAQSGILGGHDPIAEVSRDFVEPFTPGGNSAERQEFLDSRGLLERAKDAATFTASVPVRMATKGEYGIGDAVGAIAPGIGARLSRSEGDFAIANAPQLAAIGKAGELSLGLPTQIPTGLGRMPREVPKGRVVEKAVALADRQATRQADAQAMRDLGIRPFGPALTEGGNAAAVKQLTEAPLVSGPLNNALRESVSQTRQAAEGIAARYGGLVTPEEAGRTVKAGLDRFKDARPLEVLDEQVSKMTANQLSEVIAMPSNRTSMKAKQAALYERAWRGLPEDMRAGRAREDMPRVTGGLTQTREVLRGIVERNLDLVNRGELARQQGTKTITLKDIPDVALPVRGGLLGQVVKDIVQGKNMNRPLEQMRELRSEFRRLASGVADSEANVLKSADLDRVQAAITQDMVGMLERNAQAYMNAQRPDVAAQISRAIKDFRQADTFTRESFGRLERMEKLFGASTPEAIARTLTQASLSKGKGNLGLLRDAKKLLRPSEWNDLAASMIHEMGQPVGSARGVARDQGFSVQSFLTRWQNMDAEARTILFRGRAETGLADDLDKLSRVVGRLAEFEALANTSRTASNQLALGVMAGGGLAFLTNWQATLAAAGGTYAVSKFLSSQAYVRWLTRGVELSAGRNPALLRAHMKKLRILAKSDPEMQAVVSRILAQSQPKETETYGLSH